MGTAAAYRGGGLSLWERGMNVTVEEYLKQIDQVILEGKYRDDWGSLSGHKTPDWYYSGKFGIFIHWGLYSVPAYGNEWYSRNMYDASHREFDHHRRTYGDQKQFGYKDFIPLFRGERFDAERWAETFRRAGAKFVMPVAEHHDGFAMYATQFNRWNAKDMGPRVDVVGELKRACEEKGLTFCASSHRAEHYFFMNMGRTFDSDVNDERYSDFYGPAVYCKEFDSEHMGLSTEDVFARGADKAWLEDWLVRTCELVDRYRPKLVYFDWWIQNHSFKPYLKKFAAYYYNRAEEWGEEVTINYKHEAFAPGVGTFDVERGGLTDISPVPWQTDTAIGKQSWGYRADNEYKSSRQVVCDLIDVVSKNGILMLNVGPKADGTLTDEEAGVLAEVGKWLEINGEGIYGTVPWKRFGEGEVNNTAGFFQDGEEKPYTSGDFRFTYKGGCVYAFQMRPDGGDVMIKSLGRKGIHDFGVASVELLGRGRAAFERDERGLLIRMAAEDHPKLPLCFKIQID